MGDTRLQLVSDGYRLIQEFNEEHKDAETHLQPEFGNWMIEAVPSTPYGNPALPETILSVGPKIRLR